MTGQRYGGFGGRNDDVDIAGVAVLFDVDPFAAYIAHSLTHSSAHSFTHCVAAQPGIS